MKSFLSILILILLLTAGCTTQQGASNPMMIDETDIPKSAGLTLDELPEFILEDLALYNGQDGMSRLSELQKVGVLKDMVDPVLMDEPKAVT